LRNDYAKLLSRLETGEETAISRRGKIVARPVPPITENGKVDWSARAARSLARDSKPLFWRKSRPALLNTVPGAISKPADSSPRFALNRPRPDALDMPEAFAGLRDETQANITALKPP
jgi:antitoxin (DNA-binding transcriptional repressor) of toxin-antitoxin stability system